LPIPKFDEADPLHKNLAELSRTAHSIIASTVFTKRGTSGLRTEARAAVAIEIERIDELVSRLFNRQGRMKN
jgi:hypothetical protein